MVCVHLPSASTPRSFSEADYPFLATSVRYSVGVPTFRYLYDGNFTDIYPAPWQGAFHRSELPLIFGTHTFRASRFGASATPAVELCDQWYPGLDTDWLAYVQTQRDRAALCK